MSTDRIALLLAQRNARFRAWRAYGVPVDGGWGDPYEPSVTISVVARCQRCQRDGREALLQAFLYARLSDEQAIVEAVAAAERRLLERLLLSGCAHLAPILGVEPHGLAALIKLELLAGEPPR